MGDTTARQAAMRTAVTPDALVPRRHPIRHIHLSTEGLPVDGGVLGERLKYDLLFKWFLDLSNMDHRFDHSGFSKNRQRSLDAEGARQFLLEIVEQAREQRPLAEECFSPTLDQSRDAPGSLGVGKEFPSQGRGPAAFF